MTGPQQVRSDGFQFPWPFPQSPSRLYRLQSYMTMMFVQALTKSLFAFRWNSLTVEKGDRFLDLLADRSRPLITVANHRCNIDDPMCWAMFTWRQFLQHMDRYRYTMAAHNICFTKAWHTRMFSLGRCVPIVRGAGVHQPGVDFCIEKLGQGGWVHVFPEGRVVEHALPRLKWGVGRMILESPTPPVVLPLWIEGSADLWPTQKPYYPRFGKRVHLRFGEPLDMAIEVPKFGDHHDPLELRSLITALIQNRLYHLDPQKTGIPGGNAPSRAPLPPRDN